MISKIIGTPNHNVTEKKETVMDAVKQYWDRRPCNLKHSNKPFLSKEYFDEVEIRKYFVESHIPAFADFSAWNGKKVLEIGCGIGTDAVNFARNGADYTGIELSDKSLDITKTRFDVLGLKGKFFSLDAQNMEDLSIVGKDFDLIYSFGVIHHSPHPDIIIKNCFELLKTGGTFKIMMYAKNSWKHFMIESGIDQFEAQNNCPVAWTYTTKDLTDLLTSSGFSDVHVLQDHIFPYKVEKYVKYEYEPEEWFKAMPKHMFEMLEKKLGWHLCATCVKST